MSACAARVRLAGILKNNAAPIAEIPAFLCPGLLNSTNLFTSNTYWRHSQVSSRRASQRFLTTHADDVPEARTPEQSGTEARYKHFAQSTLPKICPGCGALSQSVLQDEPGYYNITRKSVRKYVSGTDRTGEASAVEEEIIRNALANAGNIVAGLHFGKRESEPPGMFINTKSIGNDVNLHAVQVLEPPVCDRCHNLREHSTGVSISHPSIQSIQSTIFESPYKYNHIYHVIDAADFPMSLIPGLHNLLHLTPQRSLNRRSKTGKFYHGQKTEVSFIIQRSDLFGFTKEELDRRMPWLREVLREALGRSGKDVRLGNIRCVSCKLSWWTKELKQEVWDRGGGGWLVGKVNVGKSQLLHDVFPKGRTRSSDLPKLLPGLEVDEPLNAALATVQEHTAVMDERVETVPADGKAEDLEWEDIEETLDTSSLLPPSPVEVAYPAMPLVSSLPGTTASPIRLPFGNGKGELIDLPGLSRGDLETHVQPDRRSDLVIRSRLKPIQTNIRPGQSLLLGGFIRITPATPNVVFLSWSYTMLINHVTNTETKAIPTQLQTRDSGIENISIPGTGEKIASAGIYYLKWDVTKERTGPLTARAAGKLSPDILPFQVFSTDILIEGVGWIELVAQVRKPRRSVTPEERGFQNADTKSFEAQNSQDVEAGIEGNENKIDPIWPAVEIFTPEGKYIGQRRPMNASLQILEKKANAKGRPRKSMKGAKKNEKRMRRTSAA
jgi:hypothetical protein